MNTMISVRLALLSAVPRSGTQLLPPLPGNDRTVESDAQAKDPLMLARVMSRSVSAGRAG